MAAFEIVQLPARSDNFAVLVHDPQSGATASIDAPDAAPILAELERRGWHLSHILVTHKHADHVEGIPALRDTFGAVVIGPALSAAETGLYTQTVEDGDTFAFGGREVRVIATPGHTLGHTSLLHEGHGLLMTADAFGQLLTRVQVGVTKPFCTDPALARRSAEKLVGFDFATAVLSHGPALREGARERLREAVARNTWT